MPRKKAEVIPIKKKTHIYWDDDEWEFLALEVHKMRKNAPTLSIVQLVNRAQEQLPENRRRFISNNDSLKPIITRLIELDDEVFTAKEELNKLKQRYSNVEDKETILTSLTDEEVLSRFGNRIISLMTPDDILKHMDLGVILSEIPTPKLLAIAMERFSEQLLEPRIVERVIEKVVQSQPQPKEKVAYRPRVTLVGFKPEQGHEVIKTIGEKAMITVVDQNRQGYDAVPGNQDIVLVLLRFISHALYDVVKSKIGRGILIQHHGGVSEAIKKLEERLLGVTQPR